MQKPHQTSWISVRAGVLDGALRPRVVGLAESLPGPSWFALLIDSGRASIANEDVPVSGPALIWRPWSQTSHAKFSAGTTGSYVVLGSASLANVVGYMPETQELQNLANRTITTQMPGRPDAFQTLQSAFRGLDRELAADRVAARAVVEAYLRIILIEIYRSGQTAAAGADRASLSHRTFTRFSELVEAHFRERWSVIDYAETLGVSRDRLGDICLRVRGLGPKELIDRRVAIEARLQLENSSNSIQQIAALLGFSSAPQFTRFFRRVTGSPPGVYRKDYAIGLKSGHPVSALPFEWP